jgi:ABC-type dipeptide/oligopeptide/nickel transport system permease subunit
VLGNLLGGIAVVETVFTIPGLGRLLVDSIFGRDYPVIQGCLLFIAFVYVLVNLVVDLSIRSSTRGSPPNETMKRRRTQRAGRRPHHGLVMAAALLGASGRRTIRWRWTSRPASSPRRRHWLGTDEFGRDVLSRLMAGAATSVWISLLAVGFAVVLGHRARRAHGLSARRSTAS